MNIFHIPSWYPSKSNPLSGRFFRDRSIVQVRNHPEISMGISTWGQNDERFLIRLKDGLRIFRKVGRSFRAKETRTIINSQLSEYFEGAPTWSWKLYKGNISNIIKCNHLIMPSNDHDKPRKNPKAP